MFFLVFGSEFIFCGGGFYKSECLFGFCVFLKSGGWGFV
jgi:hypothetical protein